MLASIASSPDSSGKKKLGNGHRHGETGGMDKRCVSGTYMRAVKNHDVGLRIATGLVTGRGGVREWWHGNQASCMAMGCWECPQGDGNGDATSSVGGLMRNFI